MNKSDMEKLRRAKEIIANKYVGTNGIHTVMIGLNKVKGQETGEPAVVALVSEKLTAQQLKTAGKEILPPYIEVDGKRVPTDIQVGKPFRDQRLHLSMTPLYQDPRSADHRRCHKIPIPGGPEIQPVGQAWVGTLSCAIIFTNSQGKEIYGALTNAHVTGMNAVGTMMVQPGRGKTPFSKVNRVVSLHFDQKTNNYIDAALMDTWMEGGIFGSGCHTVKPEQLGLGVIDPNHVTTPTLGMQLQKSGRTTGITKGRVVGVEAESFVGYDEGTAKFIRQIVVEGINNTNFSAGGDSGSLVMTMDNRPVGLLFAGGGNQTIINPIAFVLEWAKGRFFKV